MLSGKRYHEAVAAGRCAWSNECAKKPQPGKRLCRLHRDQQRELVRKSRAQTYLRAKLAGICVKCLRVRVCESVVCDGCTKLITEKAAARRAADPQRLEKARAQWKAAHRRRVAKQREKGLCDRCTAPAGRTNLCEEHRRLMNAASRSRGRNKSGRVMHCSACGQAGHKRPTCTATHLLPTIEQYATARSDAWI